MEGFSGISKTLPEVTELFTHSNFTPGLNLSNETIGMEDDFIYSIYAKGISGVFAWSALFLTCFQVTHTLSELTNSSDNSMDIL